MKKLSVIFAALQLFLFSCSQNEGMTVLTAPSGVDVKLYSGFAFEDTLIEPASIDTLERSIVRSYALEAGEYHFLAAGEGFFTLRKNFLSNGGAQKIDADPGKKDGQGYESRHDIAYCLTQECRDAAQDISSLRRKYPLALETPAFTSGSRGERYVSQKEMEDYLASKDASCPWMYLYSAGQSTMGKNIPAVLFCSEDLEGKTLEEAASVLAGDESKPTVFIHAQIHGDECSAGEGALALVSELCGRYGKKIVRKENIVIIPRVNCDGAEKMIRGTDVFHDLNRDNIFAKNPEIKATHRIYNLFPADILVDLHEYGTVAIAKEEEGFLDDAGITVSGNQNNSARFNSLMLEMMRGAEKNAAEQGIRLWEYTQKGYSDQSPLHASHYYALRGSLNFLVEAPNCRWQKESNFARRVFTQFVVARYFMDYAAANSESLLEVTRSERARTDFGPLVLKHTQNKEKYSYSRSWFRLADGIFLKDSTYTLQYYETPLLSRPFPVEYIIPKGLASEERILEIAEMNGITCRELPSGTTLPLKSYSGTEDEAFIGSEKQVTFPSGALAFPAGQPSGIILGMLMEPDMRKTDSNPISLFQAGLIGIDQIFRNENH